MYRSPWVKWSGHLVTYTFHHYHNDVFDVLTQVMSYTKSGAQQLTILYTKSPYTEEFFFKHSHVILRFAYIILEPCLMTSFVSISGCGLVLKQASKQARKQASKKASKQERKNSSTQRRPTWIWDTGNGLLRPKVFSKTKSFQEFSEEVILSFAGVCTIITQRIEKAH